MVVNMVIFNLMWSFLSPDYPRSHTEATWELWWAAVAVEYTEQLFPNLQSLTGVTTVSAFVRGVYLQRPRIGTNCSVSIIEVGYQGATCPPTCPSFI